MVIQPASSKYRLAMILVIFVASLTLAKENDNDDDIKPPQPKYPEVLSVFESMGPETALTVLDQTTFSDDSVSSMLLEAKLLTEASKYKESEKLWLRSKSHSPHLSDLAHRKLFNLRLLQKDPSGAIDYLKKIPGGTMNRRNVALYLDLADSYYSLAGWSQAETWYKKVLNYTKKSRSADLARLGIAKLRMERGDLKDALSALRELRRNLGSNAVYAETVSFEQQVKLKLNSTYAGYNESQFETMVGRLMDYSAYDNVHQTLAEWKAAYPKTTLLDKIDSIAIQALFYQRRNEEVLKACESFYRVHPGSKLTFRVRFNELLIYQRLGRLEDLTRLGSEIHQGKLGGSSGQRRNVAIILGANLVSMGRVVEGLDYYKSVYSTTGNAGTKREMLWRIGVGAFRAKQYQRAINNFTYLLTQKPSSGIRQSSYYWLARSHAAMGNYNSALLQLFKLQADYPRTYYGLMAEQRFNQWMPMVDSEWLSSNLPDFSGKPFPDLTLSRSVTRSSNYLTMIDLATAGLQADAAVYAKKLQRQFNSNKAVALLVARTLHQLGDNGDSVRIIYNHFRSQITGRYTDGPDDFERLYYPLPYWEEIEQAAKANSLDPLLMYSIMRQESRFDARVKSGVGAIGLFQIMLYTAAEIGPQLDLGTPGEEELKDPAVNSAIAGKLASRLKQMFGEAKAPMIASYNAGENRSGAWWGAASDEKLEEDLYIDTIPYGQTRQFVKEVMTNYFNYQKLAQDAK